LHAPLQHYILQFYSDWKLSCIMNEYIVKDNATGIKNL